MRKKDMSNEQLLEQYKNACFKITNYKHNKKYDEEFGKLEAELKQRLGIGKEAEK